MLEIIRFAVATYKDEKAWRKLMRNAMATDNSWSMSADKYISLYEEMCEK